MIPTDRPLAAAKLDVSCPDERRREKANYKRACRCTRSRSDRDSSGQCKIPRRVVTILPTKVSAHSSVKSRGTGRAPAELCQWRMEWPIPNGPTTTGNGPKLLPWGPCGTMYQVHGIRKLPIVKLYVAIKHGLVIISSETARSVVRPVSNRQVSKWVPAPCQWSC